MKMIIRSSAEIVSVFRATSQTRPVLLLGAGASFRAGIPMAAEFVRRIAQASYIRSVKGQDWRIYRPTPSDWIPYLRNQDWFIDGDDKLSDNFPLAVEHLLVPQEFRREFLTELIKPPHGINKGYQYLASIMQRGLCNTVLTGNFDSLIVDALGQKGPHIREIIEINKTADDLVRFRSYNRYQVVYLHGAVEFYRDKNLKDETDRLDDALVEIIRPLLKESPLVVIGYRGYEPSIMEYLLLQGAEACANYKQGIYWCIRQGEVPHERVRKLADKIGSNFCLIEIEGFDEIMEHLDTELRDDAAYQPGQTPRTSAELNHVTFDQEPMQGCTVDDLNLDLILSTLTEYCNRLEMPTVDRRNYLNFLIDQGFILKAESGDLLPTKGCYLLFGKDVSTRYPHAGVTVTANGKKRTVIMGNLIEQFNSLMNHLTSVQISPMIRVKRNRDAEEKPAYPDRALTEIVVNMLVHRDYGQAMHSRIEHLPGVSLSFTSAGGLLPKIRNRINVDSRGYFEPIRNATELRNPLLADIFYGLHHMDKQGSGLADVKEIMIEHGGKAEFSLDNENTSVCVTLNQPIQKTPGKSVTARSLNPSEIYVTNLVPFLVTPSLVFQTPLQPRYHEGRTLYDLAASYSSAPLFIRHAGSLLSFAAPLCCPDFLTACGYPDLAREASCKDFISPSGQKENDSNRNLLVWLLGKHVEMFLRERGGYSLQVDYREKRAFFRLTDEDKLRITYDLRVRKNTTRTVVTPRSDGKYFENEGIYYKIVQFKDYWALQIKPFYMFTTDGITPLPPYVRSQRSTRRMKFDRNRNVDDDLTFWICYLSKGQSVINVGGSGVDDLILGSQYVTAEVPLRGFSK